jgi:hypothetical protein
MFPITPKSLERVTPRIHGSLCDEISKLGQFDILVKSFMSYITDGCVFTEEFKSELCDNDCNSTTTTTTVCLFGETTAETTTTPSTTSTTTACPPPDAPVLVLSSAAENDVQLSFTSNTSEIWRVYRSVDGGAYAFYDFAAGGTGSGTYTDTDAPAGASYSYKVTSYTEACGESSFSNIVTANL